MAHFAASMASMASVNLFEQVGGADNPCGAQKFFHSHEVLWYCLDAFLSHAYYYCARACVGLHRRLPLHEPPSCKELRWSVVCVLNITKLCAHMSPAGIIQTLVMTHAVHAREFGGVSGGFVTRVRSTHLYQPTN